MKRPVVPMMRLPRMLALAAVCSGSAWAVDLPDPTQLSLEELMSMEVSSAARKPQALSQTATAMHVLNRDDIRRSGATSLPELLRLVPGVQVSRIDASRYAISIRGFASRYAGKLLVLQDGRTLFSPLFNGTFWEVEDPVLNDIERIEVIRGPGGTMWGANAVNGVINIITRAARDTQGTLMQAQVGTEESGQTVRHGGALGEAGHFRVHAKVNHHDALQSTDGSAGNDALNQKRAGFRVDLQPRSSDRLTLQGDVQVVRADVKELSTSLATPGVNFAPDTQAQSGANLLVRWERTVNPDHHLHLQAYVDRVEGRSDVLDLNIDTVDLEFQQRLRLTPTNELTWGAGARQVRDKTRGSLTFSLVPAAADAQIYNAFVQNEMVLSDTVRLTVGSKFEHNETTGLETQPSVRLHWQASPTDTVWAAVSRAVETPSRASLHSQVNFAVLPPVPPLLPVPVLVGLRGNPGVVAQELVAHEVGYRGILGDQLTLDLTAFYNRYEKLVSIEPRSFQPGLPFALQPFGFANQLAGHTHGVEAAAVWQVSPSWRLSGSVSSLRIRLKPTAGGQGVSAFGLPGASPSHMAQLHSRLDLGPNLELDAHLYHQGKLPDLNIPAHTRLDLRLGWRAMPGLELSLTGRDLLCRSHREFSAEDLQASQIPRNWLLQARWKY